MTRTREKVVLAWSGGKDSAMTLHDILRSDRHEIVSLLCTLTADFDRVCMHGVRRSLIERQAASIGIPLQEVFLPVPCTNDVYEARVGEALARYRDSGVRKVAFGDIFLEDIRRYRENQMKKAGMACLFPLWGRDSRTLARTFIDSGFRAVITSVDSTCLDRTFVGRLMDHAFLEGLPEGVDPSGENGEFHTFVFDGPPFREPIPFQPGEVRFRDERFYFCDLLPA